MIYKEITTFEMVHSLLTDDNAAWTFEQAESLVEYYERLSEDLDENIEWDYVAVRCEWSAYDDFNAVKNAYTYPEMNNIQDLQDNTTVLECDDNTILIQDF